MTNFMLPKWVINRIDRVRRDFLWGNNSDNTRRRTNLLNWEAACIPRKWGGLGIKNLLIHNNALLIRWWWRAHKEPDSLLTRIVLILYKTGRQPDAPLIWKKSGYFFWRNLCSILHLFTLCTTYHIHNGRSISFWFDPWSEQPILDCIHSTQLPIGRTSP
jgi:hypothetical protein